MLPAAPFDLFADWFAAAREAEPWGGAAMVLSTVGSDGCPSSRVVLLRGVADGTFRFFSNYSSRKGNELDAHPACALVFWWPTQVRQVRVEGLALRLPAADSDAYFASRPHANQLGAWASPQSAAISSRSDLEEGLHAAETRFSGGDIPRPPHWGGYKVIPRRIEFWQGGEGRLHDRFVYRRDGDSIQTWTLSRLAP